jgi:hypothetical protein
MKRCYKKQYHESVYRPKKHIWRPKTSETQQKTDLYQQFLGLHEGWDVHQSAIMILIQLHTSGRTTAASPVHYGLTHTTNTHHVGSLNARLCSTTRKYNATTKLYSAMCSVKSAQVRWAEQSGTNTGWLRG